jgi:hypothetical protein
MRIRTSHLAIIALGLAWGSVSAQNKEAFGRESNSVTSVHLEAHEGQTKFTLGDPVRLDLVFTGRSPGYIVKTDSTPYLPVPDAVSVRPEEGWVRTHSAFRGQGLNGNAMVDLGSDPVRVTVLLNRTIAFQKPGHYEVTLTTERLLRSETSTQMTTLERCDPCRTTNSIGIEIVARDEPNEALLVVSLSREIEDNKENPPGRMPKEENEAFTRKLEALLAKAASSEAAREQLEALQKKMIETVENELALDEKRQDARREAAVRLAYLGGDDAIRAKVHYIVADEEKGDANPIGPIMVDGLPNSLNFELQLDLLNAAWHDPLHVPTSILQTALRQAKELLHKGTVTDEAILWAGTPEEREAALAEYRGEINEIAATLSVRTEPNREKTMVFLKTRGVPNQFH